MKRYDNYKSSGVEWIGNIPEHWSIKPIKYLLKEGKDGIRIGPFGSSLKSDHLSPGGYKIYGQENIINNNFELGWRYINDKKFSELSDYETKTGDVLVTMMGTTGKCKVVPQNIERGIIDSHLIRLRVNEKKFIPKLFADLVNNSHYVFSQIKLTSKGSIMEGLNSTIIKNLFLLVPSIEEQTAIAKYLDEKTEQIDKLIAGKRRLIELLKEERTAIINQAVTKGINSLVKLKPSGIDWLGDIPEHWEVKKLKYLLSKVIDNRGKTPPFGTEGVPMLEVKNITDGLKSPTEIFEKFVQPEVVPSYERDKVQVSDLLISTVGATSGKVVIIENKPNYFIAQNVVGLRTIKSVNNLFFYYFLKSDYFFTSLKMINKSNTIDNLKVSIFVNNICFLPPFEEQKQVVEFIETKSSEVDLTISKIEKEIELMQEYRTALISEVVTGKITVV